uniref:uncharacterized protein LOC120345713 n=1 Tax=Styela clava TaxID=7725 RepID=UPI0019399681|nr:uncharacterized protein LOC120345713 [Styela clava]
MAQSIIDQLQEKNNQLEEEIKTCRDLFNNLNEEKDLESRDNRRAFMLKAQIYQLERQCMLFSQAQSSRAQVLTEIESQLKKITDILQHAISGKTSGPTVPMDRRELMDLVGTLQKLKNSLYKQSSLESADSLRIQSMMSGSKYANSQKPVDCYDVCTGHIGHINLKQVAHLEQDLSALYGRLCGLKYFLHSSIVDGKADKREVLTNAPSAKLTKPVVSKIHEETNQCIEDLAHCCSELVSLSLLYPNAPWHVIKRSKQTEMTPEKIMQTFPPVAQKNRQIQSSVSSVCKMHNYLNHMNDLKLNAAELQISFHKAIYKIQLDYLNDLSECIIEAFHNSERNMLKTVCDPVAAILNSWYLLKQDQSGDHLKKFLSDMKQYEGQLKAVSELKVTEKKLTTGGSALLNNFKEALNSALKKVETEYKHKFADAERHIEHYK